LGRFVILFHAVLNVGNLNLHVQRLNEAGAAYTEGLIIRWQMAKENAAAYLPNLVTTLKNLLVTFTATRCGSRRPKHPTLRDSRSRPCGSYRRA
jgi:hypothetical protein